MGYLGKTQLHKPPENMTALDFFKPLRFVFALSTLCAHAQINEGLGSWNVVNLRLDWNERWNALAEAQLRSLLLYRNFHYYEWKGGIGYKINSQASAFLGAGSYQTYDEGGDFVTPKINNELRIWGQFSLKNTLGRAKLEHRYRWENRFALQGFLLRFRYRFQVLMPLNRREIRPGTLCLLTWNELFLSNHVPYFQRNRFFAGAFYEFTPRYAMQLGWVNQFDFSVEDEIGRNFLQISLLFSLKRKQTDTRSLPSSEE